MTVLTGFPPIIGDGCRVLILGSMPSAASLKKAQYYAHPRNAFWPIIEELFEIKREWSYSERCDRLAGIGVGVWDVLRSCRRPGSMDSAIEKDSEQANDFVSLFSEYRDIRAVFFNGGTAEQLFSRHVYGQEAVSCLRLELYRLPSSSPAYASMPMTEKVEQWRKLLDYL
jgi:hypoxanthine-DNA glycosylase